MKKVRKKKQKKSPRIYRYIPDRIKFFKAYKRILKAFTVLIFTLAIIAVGYDLYKNLGEKKKIDLEREKLTNELRFWERFLENNKGYRDAYFQASILQYRLGNENKAKDYAEKGLSLDPNSQSGKKIQELLEEN